MLLYLRKLLVLPIIGLRIFCLIMSRCFNLLLYLLVGALKTECELIRVYIFELVIWVEELFNISRGILQQMFSDFVGAATVTLWNFNY